MYVFKFSNHHFSNGHANGVPCGDRILKDDGLDQSYQFPDPREPFIGTPAARGVRMDRWQGLKKRSTPDQSSYTKGRKEEGCAL